MRKYFKKLSSRFFRDFANNVNSQLIEVKIGIISNLIISTSTPFKEQITDSENILNDLDFSIFG